MSYYAQQRKAFSALANLLEQGEKTRQNLDINLLEIEMTKKFEISFLAIRKFIIKYARSREIEIIDDFIMFEKQGDGKRSLMMKFTSESKDMT